MIQSIKTKGKSVNQMKLSWKSPSIPYVKCFDDRFFLYQNTKLLNISVITTHTSTYTLRRNTTKYFIETETK